MSAEDDQDEWWLDDEPRGPSLRVLSILAMGTLGLAVAGSVWLAFAFGRRGAGDLRIYQGRINENSKTETGLEDKAEYTGGFLAQALLPLGIAVLLCAVAVIAWHGVVDRAARDWGGGLSLERAQALGGWAPIANLVMPLKALRELTEVHRAWLASRVIWLWWAPWTVAMLLSAFAFNAAFAWSPFYDAKGDPTPADIAALDKYGVIVGAGLAVSAVAMIVVVLSLTTAVAGRYGADDDED